jgi:hypothetical protein
MVASRSKPLALLQILLLTLSVPRATPLQAQVAPLSFAATGVATSLALDAAEKKANNFVQQSGAVASLTSSKVARDLQMLISDTRQQLHEELNYQWDTLEGKKVDLLRSIDGYFSKLNATMVKGGLLEEDAYLDIAQLEKNLPFTSVAPVLSSVRGSTLVYQQAGIYRVTIRGSIFSGKANFTLNGVPIGTDVKVMYTPPYEAALVIPAGTLEHYFKDTSLAYVPATVEVQVFDRSYWFAETRNKTRPAVYNFTLQLLPKHPVSRYSLIEMNEEPSVDRNVVKTDWSEIVLVPGCGSDGCNSGQPICADVPAGAEPIGVVDHYDSLLNAWGEFVGPPYIAGGTICQNFHQHRPAARNVKIKISYYPADTNLIAEDVRFQEVSVEDTAKSPIPSATELGFDRLYVAYFSKKMKSFRLGMTLFTGEPLGATKEKASSPLLELSTAIETNIKEITIEIKPPW